MKVAEQVQLLTLTFSLLKEVQPPQGDTSGARKEANPTAEDEVNYVPTRDNGLPHGNRGPGITVDEPNYGATSADFRKELEAQNKEMEKRLTQQFNDKMKALMGVDGFEQMGITGLPAFQTGLYPEKFKTPDFEKYDGTGCPKLHARLYVRRMSQYLQHEHIMIQTFQDSLTGSALTWYAQVDLNEINTWDKLARAFYNQYKFNMEVAPSMWDLSSLRKGNNESFREYAQH